MFQFKATQSIASRVNRVIQSHIETRGEVWLVNLGYAECNDFAQLVVDQVSYVGTHKEFIRFETVARYVRSTKAMIRRKLELQAKSQSNTSNGQ